MAIDQKAIEEHIRGILTALGDDRREKDWQIPPPEWLVCMPKCSKA